MILESTDNAYKVNQKLSNILNNEDEEQYITKKFEINYTSNIIDNENITSLNNLVIDYKNDNLCTGTVLDGLFNKTFCSLNYNDIDADVERFYNFNSSLSGSVVTFLFSKVKNNIEKDNIIEYYPYIFLPQNIENYKLRVDWAKEISGKIIIQLISNENEVIFELTINRVQIIDNKTKTIHDMIILFNKDADYLIKEVE